MDKTEQHFDVSILLKTLFSSLETIRHEKNIELIYDMEATIPRELRGDFAALLRLLIKILTFIFQNTDKKEIVLSLGAPEDFLYEELMSFEIKDTNIAQEKILEFLESNISRDLETLRGKVVYEKAEDVHIDIPFRAQELGYRRHYRLPHISMLGKRVLLICVSKKVSHSIEKMLKYFLYTVDVGLEAYKVQGNNLASYDILIVEDRLSTDALNDIIMKAQQNIPLKCVILQDSHMTQSETMPCVSTHLVKPVTQESIFELILSLYRDEGDKIEIKINEKNYSVDIEKYLQEKKENPIKANTVENHLKPLPTFQNTAEARKGIILPILDKVVGEKNTKNMGSNYKNELKIFLDIFDRSDLYFRQIVNEKAISKIKQFSIDLEKQSKIIGAQSMLKFADTVSLIFVYNKLDMLVIYPGKYHIELRKLIEEIKKELYIK